MLFCSVVDQINVMDYTMNTPTSQAGRAALKTSNGCLLSGINEKLHDNLIIVYPNPTNGNVNFKIAMNINVRKIGVQNVLGEEIFSASKIQDDIFTLNLSNYPQGIYFAIIDTDKGRSVEKIIFSK